MTLNKQRVTIQYSIYLDELEGELVKLTRKVQSAIEKASLAANTIAKQGKEGEHSLLEYSTIDSLNSAREELSNADNILMDCTTIIEGYLRYRNQPSVERQAPIEEVDTLTSKLSEIQEQISHFREASGEANENAP